MNAIKNVPGNFEDKYNTKNPISKILVNGFLDSLKSLLSMDESPGMILEAGAGEGHLTKIIAQTFPNSKIFAGDIENEVNNLAKKNLSTFKNVTIQKEDVENLSFKNETFDLVICCEVLEHVPHPRKALASIYKVLKKNGHAILSVPHEPIWRILNMARGKYLRDLGNTPGHINHWSSSAFVQTVSEQGFHIIKRNQPFPWTMLLTNK